MPLRIYFNFRSFSTSVFDRPSFRSRCSRALTGSYFFGASGPWQLGSGSTTVSSA